LRRNFTSGPATRKARIPLQINDCRLQVVKRSYKGTVATLTVQSPVAGRVTISGRYLRTQRRTIRVAGHTKIRVPLSRLGAALLRKKRSSDVASRRKLILAASIRLRASKPAERAKKMAGPTTVRRQLTFR